MKARDAFQTIRRFIDPLQMKFFSEEKGQYLNAEISLPAYLFYVNNLDG